MSIDTDRSRSLTASQPTDWKRSFAAFASIFILGAAALLSVAVITGLLADSSSQLLWASVVSDWALVSTSHVTWSAPVLIATAGALTTLSNSSLGNDEQLRDALTVAAHVLGVGAALWVTTALVSMVVPGTPEVWAARQQLWGVILIVGPVAIGAGLAAGRFPRVSPEAQLASGEKNLRDLDAQLDDMRQHANAEWSMSRARSVAWLPPIAVGASCVTALIVLLSAEGVTQPRVFATWISAVIALLLFWAAPVGLLRVLWAQPLGGLWRRDEPTGERRPTAWGSATLVALILWASAALALCIVVIVLVLTAPAPYGMPDRLAYAAVFGGGPTAMTLALLLRRGGRNAWATIGYLRRARFRAVYITQIEQARAELNRRRREARSRAPILRAWDALRGRKA
ncbi:hypothetical protein AB0O90_10500 [Microbacterium testaceum]|uniref:hypothetical protein n=1 Tax=Microbacterium testaceum TaxID=2033 RepID=UPI0034474ED0